MRFWCFAAALVLAASLAIPAGVASGSDETGPKFQPAAAGEQGLALGEKDVQDPFFDEPMYRFYQARQDYLLKDLARAAVQIRRGATYLKREAAVATGRARDDLSLAVQALQTLADAVEGSSVSSFKALDRAFAQAERALARHYALMASALWTQGSGRAAGRELRASAAHLEQALTWLNHEMESPTSSAVRRAEQVAQQMIQGTGFTPEDVPKAIQGLQKEIDAVDGLPGPPKP